MHRHSTPQALKLKEALEQRGLVLEAEKWDGHKSIDLVIGWSRLNIEVDGKQHYESPLQILSDFKRNHYSDLKGFDTIHVPNAVIDSKLDLNLVAEAITAVAKIRAHKLGFRHHYRSYD